MDGIYLTGAELSALLECSLEAMRLYVLAVRPCVDIRTGVVGRSSRVGLARLGINAGFHPPQGSKRTAWMPNHRQVECLLEELARNGLVERCAVPAERLKLVLRLPLVTLVGDLSRPEYERAINGQSTGNRKDSKVIENKGFFGCSVDNSIFDERAISEYQSKYKSNHHLSNKLARENSGHFDDEDGGACAPAESHDAAVSGGAVSVWQDKTLVPFVAVLASHGWAKSKVLPQLSELRRLIAAGLDVRVLSEACELAGAHGARSVRYVLCCVDSVMSQSSGVIRSSSGGSARPAGRPWFLSSSGIEEKARDLGVVQHEGEPFPSFRLRVYRAAGLSRSDYRAACVDFGVPCDV